MTQREVELLGGVVNTLSDYTLGLLATDAGAKAAKELAANTLLARRIRRKYETGRTSLMATHR